MDKQTALLLAVVVSEIVAIFVIWRIWRANDYVAMKILLTVLAVIPVVGTLGALWIVGFPDSQPEALQDKSRYSTDVFDRWRHVFEEKDEDKKRRSFRNLIRKGHDVDGGPIDRP